MSEEAFAQFELQMRNFSLPQLKALRTDLDELIEDAEDIADAQRVWAEVQSGKQQLIPAEHVYRELGL